MRTADGLDVTFDASTSFSEASAGLEYRFEFRAGVGYTAWQFEPEITHSYSTGGDYTATVEVRDQGNNKTDTDSTAVSVTASGGTGNSGGDGGNDSSIAF